MYTITKMFTAVLTAGMGFGLAACLGTIDADAGSLRGTHRLAFDYSSRTSCSRSSAATTRKGTVKMTLSGRAVQLRFDVVEYHRMGPSFGAFRQGQRQSYSTHKRRTILWKGRVKASSGGAVSITLSPSQQTCLALPRYGTRGAKKYKCPSVSVITLRCVRAKAQAYPKRGKTKVGLWLGKNEKSRAVSVLRCATSGLPSIAQSAQLKRALVLGDGSDLTLYRREGGLSSSWWRKPPILRR